MKASFLLKYSLLPFLFLLHSGFVSVHHQTEKDRIPNRIRTDTLAAETLTDVSYGPDPKQKFDLYLPKGRNENTPVLIMVHGGAWVGGDKGELSPFARLLSAQQGNPAVVNMNYRLAGRQQHTHQKEMMEDFNKIIYQLYEDKARYVISDKIGIIGASAGAHLAMMYAYHYDKQKRIKCVADFFGPVKLDDREWYDRYSAELKDTIGNFITEYVGSAWNINAYRASSPLYFITPDTPPTIIFQGTEDNIVPPIQSRMLRDRLKQEAVPFEYYTYKAGHGFALNQYLDAAGKLAAFFRPYLE